MPVIDGLIVSGCPDTCKDTVRDTAGNIDDPPGYDVGADDFTGDAGKNPG